MSDDTTIRVVVTKAQAEAFHAACQIDGGVSFVLRQFVHERIGTTPTTRGRAAAHQVQVRLSDEERIGLVQAADARGVSPAGYVRQLVRAHLLRRPQWTDETLTLLRSVFRELRRLSDVDEDAMPALARTERVVGGVLSGELAYWGGDELARGALARDAEAVRATRARVRDTDRRARARLPASSA